MNDSDYIKAMKIIIPGFEALKQSMDVLLREMTNAINTFSYSVYRAYKQIGAPYGEDLDGFEKWIKEIKDHEPT